MKSKLLSILALLLIAVSGAMARSPKVSWDFTDGNWSVLSNHNAQITKTEVYEAESAEPEKEVDHVTTYWGGALINGSQADGNWVENGLEVSTGYVEAPTITFIVTTDTYYVGEMEPYSQNDSIDVLAYEQAGKWYASYDITTEDGDMTVYVSATKLEAATITYMNGTTVLGTEVVAKSTSSTKHANFETLENHEFQGWCLDAALTNPVDVATYPVGQDITYYGKFVEIQSYVATFTAANAYTIGGGKASVRVDGGNAPLDAEGKLSSITEGQNVILVAKRGYKFRKASAQKGEEAQSVTTDAASEQDLFTTASFVMPAGDVTVSYELVRDMQDDVKPVAFAGLPFDGKIAVAEGQNGKYQPKEALDIQLVDSLAEEGSQNIIASDDITIKVLVGGENEMGAIDYDHDNPMTLDAFLADMKPGYYWIKAEPKDETSPYEGVVYSTELTVAASYDLNLADAADERCLVLFTVNDRAVTQAVAGDEVKVFVMPAEGYEVKNISVRAYTTWDAAAARHRAPALLGEIATTKMEDNMWQFTMPAANVVLTVEYIAQYEVVFATGIEHGSVVGIEADSKKEAEGKITVNEGDQVVVNTTADEGYELDAIIVTGVESETTYTVETDEWTGEQYFIMPEEAVTVSATFREAYVKLSDYAISVNNEFVNDPDAGDEIVATLTYKSELKGSYQNAFTLNATFNYIVVDAQGTEVANGSKSPLNVSDNSLTIYIDGLELGKEYTIKLTFAEVTNFDLSTFENVTIFSQEADSDDNPLASATFTPVPPAGIGALTLGADKDAVIFDLQGRRVTKPMKGRIYIVNGMKVMTK